VSSGLAGALSGPAAIPAEWVKQVDYAVTLNRVTNTQRTLRQHADGLYEAFRARLERMRQLASMMANA
jgi:uncharacterized lipoprotein YmbA